jgi:uncharacterized protein (DUF1684 family)
MSNLTEYEELADYRRSVAELYMIDRNRELGLADPWKKFYLERDRLFIAHPKSAQSLTQKLIFTGLRIFNYDPRHRLLVEFDSVVEAGTLVVELPEEGSIHLLRIGRVHFSLDAQSLSLTLFWIQGYGGGIFLPFRDQTNSYETYGGGRYLLDTIKMADWVRKRVSWSSTRVM